MTELIAFFHDYRTLTAALMLVMTALGFIGGMFLTSKLGKTLYSIFEQAMTVPEVNSRLVFLIHGVVTGLGILAISIGFLFAKDRTGFPVMVGAIGGGGVGAALGRYFTKSGDGKQGDTNGVPKQ